MKTEAEIRAWINEQQRIVDREHEEGETGGDAWCGAMTAIAWLQRVLGE